MRRYLLRTLSVTAAYLTAHFLICLYVPSPIAAEYWVRELIVVQHNLANPISSPRIIFLGGSNLLFGIDAREVEEATGIHALNMGMHGGLRLERVLSAGQDVARPGDIFVLALEPFFFSCDSQSSPSALRFTPPSTRNDLHHFWRDLSNPRTSHLQATRPCPSAEWLPPRGHSKGERRPHNVAARCVGWQPFNGGEEGTR